MLVKFNLITFLFQPLCIFYTHFPLHFKHFDYILLVGLAWFCRKHWGREKTRGMWSCFLFFWQLTGRLFFIYEPRWMRSQPEILCDFANNMSTRNVFAPALKYPMRCWKHLGSSSIFRGALAPFWELEHIHQANRVKGRSLQQWCDGNSNRQGPVPSLWRTVWGRLYL